MPAARAGISDATVELKDKYTDSSKGIEKQNGANLEFLSSYSSYSLILMLSVFELLFVVFVDTNRVKSTTNTGAATP
jgi:hypothetical protein